MAQWHKMPLGLKDSLHDGPAAACSGLRVSLGRETAYGSNFIVKFQRKKGSA
jgi:hypothetical protein